MRLYHILIGFALVCACTRIQETRCEFETGRDITLNVSMEDLASKATYTADASGLKCSWDAGDSISIVSLHNGAVASVNTFTTESGGRIASFRGRFSGRKTDAVIAVFPALKNDPGNGYCSAPLPGNIGGVFKLSMGGSSLLLSPDTPCVFSQSANGDFSHVAYIDIMTGDVDINTDDGSVTLSKHVALIKVTASIPSLPTSEKILKLTLKSTAATPFTDCSASLPLASASGVWTTSVPSDSTVLNFGAMTHGVFAGFSSSNRTLTAYVPVFPNSGTPAFQGDSERKLTVTVTTDLSVYSAEKTIPAKTGSEYSFPLEAGTINTINATLSRTGDADSDLTEWVRTVKSLADVNVKADALKTAILNSQSEYTISGTTYYVSNSGNDNFNSGTSPSSPFKTLDKVNSLTLNKGDGVLFKRGDVWRGKINMKNGVTYSAYGEGQKPRIYGSPCDAAKEGSWSTTSVSNIYRYSKTISQDAGTLIFEEGNAGCAYKVVPRKDYDGNTWHPVTMESFTGWQDLKRDLDMYHDRSTGYIYLYSASGNPKNRWTSIEIPVRQNVFDAWGNNGISAVVDNICIKYTGAHGVGTGNVKSLVVTNCEIGWIGGSLQNNNHETAPTTPGQLSRIVRYGNGVEIYGTCEEFRVDHNWIYQVYDAGVTHQYTEKTKPNIYCDNVSYVNNLIERCVYAIEYWLSVGDEYLEQSGMRNFLIKGNIMRMTGEWSWGFQRFNQESPAVIKTWNNKCRAINYRMEKNIIDRGKPTLLNINAARTEWLPLCRANVYFHQWGADLGTMIEENPKLYYVFN